MALMTLTIFAIFCVTNNKKQNNKCVHYLTTLTTLLQSVDFASHQVSQFPLLTNSDSRGLSLDPQQVDGQLAA